MPLHGTAEYQLFTFIHAHAHGKKRLFLVDFISVLAGARLLFTIDVFFWGGGGGGGGKLLMMA